MSNLYRIIRYGGLKDSLDFSAREMMTLLSLYSGEGKEISTKLSNEIGMKYRTFLNKPTLSNSQVNLLNAIRKAFQFAISQPELKFSPQLPTIQQTINNALSWNNYNPQGVQNTFNGAQIPNVTLINNPVDQWPQNWIKIIGLPLKKTQDVFENPFAKSLKSQLGNWVSINNDELLIRGTKQAWEKFINISRWYLANLSSFLDIDFLGTLPDEPDLKSDNEKAKEQKKINVAVHENVISIFFDKTTPYYIKDIGEIVDYIDTVLEMPISSYRIHWENGLLQFIAPANEAKRIDIATQLYILSNKLKDPQGFNYQSIDFNNAIKAVFGVSMRETQEDDRKRKKSNLLSDKTVANNLRKNLLTQPFIANRFSQVEGHSFEEKVKNIYSSNTKINENKPYGPDNWVGPFGETTNANQQKMQLEGIKYLTSRKVSILADEPGSGKCLSSDSLCVINGNVHSMEEIWNKYADKIISEENDEQFFSLKEPLNVISVNSEGKTVLGNVTAIFKQKYKGKIKKIRTSNGKEIKCSFAHKFLTPSGWTNNLKNNDVICSSYNQISDIKKINNYIDSNIIELLAWQIAEGYEYSCGRVKITQKDENILYYLKSLYDNLQMGNSYVKYPKNRCSYLNVCSVKYKDFLKNLGYVWGNRSKDKIIPEFIMNSGKENIKIFLRAFFDAEGYSSSKTRIIGISSASKILMQQISYLLSKFNINHSMHNKLQCATNTIDKKKKLYYELTINGRGIDNFMKEIGFSIKYKNENIINQKTDRNPNKEGKPVNNILKPLIDKYNLPFRHLGISNQKYLDGTRMANNSIIDRIIENLVSIVDGSKLNKIKANKNKWTHDTVKKYSYLDLNDFYEAINKLYILKNNDISYEKIISVEEIDYDGYIYDLTVDEYHNYLAEGGIICHNTAQAIIAADVVRDNNQKILVFTPNSLLAENWLGKKAKGPMFFCGHAKEQVVNVETKEDLDEAVNNPNVIWIIVVKESTFTQGKKEADDLANAINKYSKSKVFASLIVDEIQQYKDPEGKAFTKMQQAISWDGIPFRFGLSGTPADNTPDDIFAQLRLLRHDVIRDTKGEKGGYSQNEEGFASQFLGGPELSKIVALSRDKVSNNIQEISDDWRQKCYSVLEWAKGVTPSGKENIANLFSQTFLRREKSEIRDIPLDDSQKIIVKNVPQPPEEMMKAVDWKSKISKFNALAKVNSTVEKAIALLKADPKRQIFIASKFVDVVDSIANGINKIAGEGTAFGIHGGIKDLDRRDELVQTFKAFDKAKTFNHPIRVLVYTLDTGAVGLNFSNCDTGILNDLDDNPSVNLQAQYRVHRIDSKKPVTIFFTQFDDTVNSPAANYDRSCYERIQQKKKINSEICKLMKKVRNAKNPQEKMLSANEFVINTIENIILDIGFDKHTQDFFFKNIQKAINGEAIEPLEKIEVNKKKDEFEQMGHALIPFLPKDYKEKIEQAQTVKDIDSILYDSKNWLNQTSSDVANITGKSLEDLSKDEIVKALEQMSSPEYTSKQLLERMRRVYKMRYEKYDPTLEGFNEWLQEENPGLYNKTLANNWYQKIKTGLR